MKPDFECNETMRELGYQNVIDAASPDGKAVTDILDGLGLPVTSENVLLGTYCLTMGRILERRKSRRTA